MDRSQYRNLSPREIRLIELHLPNTTDPDEIYISLIHVSTDEGPEYAALSYAWGDPIRAAHVNCDGKWMPVTENLFAALRGIRSRFEQEKNQDAAPTSFLVWADAICIDQSNSEELGAQVQLMGSIFGRAYGVLSWLGEEDEGMDEALKFIRELRDMLHNIFIAEKKNIPDVVRKADIPPADAAAWKAFDKLFTCRPYFSRTWVVQEIALAKKCMLLSGKETIPWHFLAEAVQACHYYAEHVTDPLIRFYQPHQLEAVRRQFEQGAPRPLSLLLFRFRMCKCSDPRDKVYALLGLSDSTYANTIVPDYTASIAEVYQPVSRTVMIREASLELLSAVPPHPTPAFNLPSWVPDWTMFINRIGSLGPDSFDASAGITPQIRPCPDPSVLNLKGHKLSILHAISPPHQAPHWFESSEYGRNAYAAWFETALALRTYPTGETVIQALALTLLGGRKATIGWPLPQEDIEHSVQQLLRVGWKLFPTSGRPHQLKDENVDITDFLFTMEAITPGRRIAVTEDGYIGLVPDSAEVGDTVCLLYGGRTPYVLRKLRDDGDWRFIGESYIHGLMAGEGMSRPDIAVEEFVLR